MNQNKILVGILFLLLITFASAEVGIKSVDVNNFVPPYIKGNDVNFGVQIFNDSNDSGTATLKATSQGIILEEKTISVPANSDFNSYIFWNKNTINTSTGIHNVLFELTSLSLSDSNSENNSFLKIIKFFNGSDLTIFGLQVTTTSPQPNQEISIVVSVKQNGDLTTSSFNTCFFYDNVQQKCQTTTSITPNETKNFTFNFTVPADFVGTHTIKLITDNQNEIVETDENNNVAILQLSTIPLPDLFIDSSDISISSAVAGETVTIQAIIKNIGSLSAQNFLVKAYFTSALPEYLIHSETISSLAPNAQQSISFTYTPQIEGYNIIAIVLDSANVVTESNEENNYSERGFEIQPADSNMLEATSFTLFQSISNSCVMMLSNNDRLVSKGIIEDGNGNYLFSFDLIDSFGKSLISTQAKDGFERILPGRTLKVLSVSRYLANLLFVYQKPVSVLYTTCEKNISDAITEAEAFKESFRACQATLSETTTKYNTELATKDAMQSQLSISNEGLSLCNNEKSTLSTNLSLKEDSCQEKISLMMANQDTQCKELQQLEKDKTETAEKGKKTAEDERTFWMILFFTIPLLVGGTLIYIKSRRD